MTNEIILPGGASDALKWADAIFQWITSAPIELVGVIVIIILGYALKMAPGFPTRFIPIALFGLSVGFYAFGLSPSKAPSSATNPQLFMGMIGVIVWFVAWMAHTIVLRRFIDDKFLGKDDQGNTVLLKKQDAKDG